MNLKPFARQSHLLYLELREWVADIKETADTVGQNVVCNFFRAPLNLMTGISEKVIKSSGVPSKKLKKITGHYRRKAFDFINYARAGDNTTFTTDGAIKGSAELLADLIEENILCRKILLRSQEKGKMLPSQTIETCRDSKGKWSIKHN